MPTVNSEFEELTEGEDEDRKQKFKAEGIALEAIGGSANRISLIEEELGVSPALALAVLREETTEITPRLAFFQRVAKTIRRRLANDLGPTPGRGGSQNIDAALGQVVGDKVDAGEVAESAPQAGDRKQRTC